MNNEQLKYFGMVPLNEMSLERAELKKRWESDFRQITINFCLVYMAQNTERLRIYEDHWKTELTTQLTNASLRNLRKGNTSRNRARLMRETLMNDNMDLNIFETVSGIIYDKFSKEKIKTSGPLFRNCVYRFIQELPNLSEYVCFETPAKISKYVRNLDMKIYE